MYDVLVMGGGLAGATAALLARADGARVALANRSYGATALGTGALDIAFAPALSPAEQTTPRTLADHVEDIIAQRPRHPYAVLGRDRCRDGLSAGWQVLTSALREGGLEVPPLDLTTCNIGAPSSLGTVVPAGQVLPPHRGLDLSMPLPGRWGALQLRGDTYFDARRVAVGLTHDARRLCGAELEIEVVQVSFPATESPVRMARRLDDRATLDRLAADVAAETAGRGLDGLLVSPILGLERFDDARALLAQAVGGPVVEALAHVPSVPGLRLQRALDDAVARAHIDSVGELVSTTSAGDTVQAAVTRDGVRIEAGAFVLATGRFVAGGVEWETTCREALLGLPVVSERGPMEEDSPEAVVRESPAESHPLMTAGVQIDAACQPLREGRVALRNLFAAGMVVGGFASRYALCADGVALSTGVTATRGALRWAGGQGR